MPRSIRSMPSRPQFHAMSVAFDDQGEIVPTRCHQKQRAGRILVAGPASSRHRRIPRIAGQAVAGRDEMPVVGLDPGNAGQRRPAAFGSVVAGGKRKTPERREEDDLCHDGEVPIGAGNGRMSGPDAGACRGRMVQGFVTRRHGKYPSIRDAPFRRRTRCAVRRCKQRLVPARYSLCLRGSPGISAIIAESGPPVALDLPPLAPHGVCSHMSGACARGWRAVRAAY